MRIHSSKRGGTALGAVLAGAALLLWAGCGQVPPTSSQARESRTAAPSEKAEICESCGGCAVGVGHTEAPRKSSRRYEVSKTDAEWKRILTPDQYTVLRLKGTERPFTGKYYKNDAEGDYVCAGCGQVLFSSSDKYDSGSGWPSFTQAIKEGRVEEVVDRSQGMVRTEVRCARCGGHLGHVFPDGPAPTGMRYCVNSVSLDFRKR